MRVGESIAVIFAKVRGEPFFFLHLINANKETDDEALKDARQTSRKLARKTPELLDF